MRYERFVWIIGLLVGLCTVPATVRARQAPVVWQQTEGPYGASFSVLAADPYTGHLWTFAAGAGYVSEDGGETWLARPIPEPASYFAFRSDGTLFAGFYRLTTPGSTFSQALLHVE